MTTTTQDTPSSREPCCIHHDGYPPTADACGATRDGDGDRTHRCTRPDGHDGAHVACDGDPTHEHTEVWF